MKYFLTLFGVKNNVVENLTVTQFVIHDGGEWILLGRVQQNTRRIAHNKKDLQYANNCESGSKICHQSRKRRTYLENKCENKTYVWELKKKNLCGLYEFKTTYYKNCNNI